MLADRRPDAYGAITDPDFVIPAVPPAERSLLAVRGQIPLASTPTSEPVA